MRRCCFLWLLACWPLSGLADMQVIDGFSIDRTEVSVGAFRLFANETGFVSKAEREGGGRVYEDGWTQKKGWTWQAPFGQPASDQEPAVHLTFDEAEAYCQWAGKRLPTEEEWRMAAYLELRPDPGKGFVRNINYPYPTGSSLRAPIVLKIVAQHRPLTILPNSIGA